MSKIPRRFEAVPLAEVLATVVDVSYDSRSENLCAEDGSAAVNINDRRKRPLTHDRQLVELPPQDGNLNRERDTATEALPRTKRILVVDDERHIADTLAAMFRNMGYQSTACYDAISALSECEASYPDLLIADTVMPGMNGVELAMLVTQLYPASKILLTSEAATGEDLLRRSRQNGYDFESLAKPLPLAELVTRTAALISEGD